jgi:hypothetical protein
MQRVQTSAPPRPTGHCCQRSTSAALTQSGPRRPLRMSRPARRSGREGGPITIRSDTVSVCNHVAQRRARRRTGWLAREPRRHAAPRCRACPRIASKAGEGHQHHRRSRCGCHGRRFGRVERLRGQTSGRGKSLTRRGPALGEEARLDPRALHLGGYSGQIRGPQQIQHEPGQLSRG